MKYHDNGCFHSVTVSRYEVEDFKSTWPCSGLPDRSIWFQFEKDSGDLIDMKPSEIDGDGLSALADDAKQYAFNRLAAAQKKAQKAGAQ